MVVQDPVNATSETLRSLLPLAHSQDIFLSACLDTTRSEHALKSARLKLASMLDQFAADLEGSSFEKPFKAEREAVESYIANLAPGSDGLLIFSASSGEQLHAFWLPAAPAMERARYGAGIMALPIVELLDEWEPVGFVGVAKDKARLLVVETGIIGEAGRLESSVPRRTKAVGGAAVYRGPGGSKREQGGGKGLRFERHIDVHMEGHFDAVIDKLAAMQQSRPFRRLFLSGPPESLAKFKDALPRAFKDLLAGELSVAGYASDNDALAKVREEARRAEREQEEALVQDLINRAEKDQNAVARAAATVWALNRRQVHLLVIDAESNRRGRYCFNCALLLPPEDVMCPQCVTKTRAVNLLEEAVNSALGQGARLELVHGKAAEQLRPYEGIGAVLQMPTR